jgi:hypothetical protein
VKSEQWLAADSKSSQQASQKVNDHAYAKSAIHKVGHPSRTDGRDWVLLTLTSASLEGIKSKFRVMKKTKVKVVMKRFGKEHKTEYKKNLSFFLGSLELTGDEQVGELNGSEIKVVGEILPSKC